MVLRSGFCSLTAFVLAGLLTCLPGTAFAGSSAKTIPLVGSSVSLVLPNAAGNPKKISSTKYSISPKAANLKFVMFVTKEALKADERQKSSGALATSIRQMLEAEGYEISSVKIRGSAIVFNFETYSSLPWQKVGTTKARGIARFIRTSGNNLLGAVLFCEPSQWATSANQAFRSSLSNFTAR